MVRQDIQPIQVVGLCAIVEGGRVGDDHDQLDFSQPCDKNYQSTENGRQGVRDTVVIHPAHAHPHAHGTVQCLYSATL